MRVIRNKDDHDEFWSHEDQAWVSRENATEFSVVEQEAGLLPPNGEWVDPRHGKTFKIVRKYKDPAMDDEEVKTGLTFDEARDHCNDPDTSGDGWMDVFYEE